MPETPPQPLPHNDPQFELFEIACAMKEQVRIRYLSPVPDDPALPEDLRKIGLDTVAEGHAISINAKSITFSLKVLEAETPSPEAMQTIAERTVPRDKVLEIHRIGPGSPVFESRA